MRFLLSLLLGLVLVLPAYSATLYKWVDKNGEVRYSDKLPAGQSKKRFQTLTSTGRVLSTKEKSKSPEELRAERAEKKRLDQKASIKAEKASKLAALQEHHDNVLLMTFTNENEILEAQDERLAVIDSVIKLLRKNVKTEQEKLLKEENLAKKLYLDKELPVPGGLAQKIEYFTDKVISRQQHLSLKLEERNKIKQQYVQDLIRYRELTALKKQ
ncbi:MAG: DUF4124 domain-containing protein [Gammaproteobacteria bacterium]|nr:DUF4124 domain-containing protein [Gammaproteobacteria bacterium]